jgi:L-lactate dehydrogenase (cytochrome)
MHLSIRFAPVLLAVLSASMALAQEFPTRPIKIVVPFSPGGAVDGPTRVIAQELSKRAAEIGCTGVVLSNHGGRQLDGSRSAFDQLAEIVDAVGDRLDVMMDGGILRGTHVLKAFSLGAKAVGLGRYYLFPLAAAGEAGVERALGLLRAEIERGMKLMGRASVSQLSRDNLRFR